MNIKLYLAIVMAFVSLIASEVFAQSENFKLGKQAYLDGRNREAIKHLQIAVNDEKFFMKGKEIPLAYAYMALIKNGFLETGLKRKDLSIVRSNPGTLSSSISDIKNAVEFSGGNVNNTVYEAKKLLAKNAYTIGKLVTDKILEMENFETGENEDVKILAGILNYELKSFSDIDSNSWQIYDMLGFTHYLLDQKDLAMLDYKRAREIYQSSNTSEVSELHLYNYIYSTNYHFIEAKNYAETDLVTKEGIDYIEKMAHTPGYDTMDNIKRLSGIEGRLSSIRKQLKNVNTISSTKE